MNQNTLAMPLPDNYVLAALAYFDLFSYPLTRSEIVTFLPAGRSAEDVSNALELLLKTKQVFNFGRYYLLRNDFSLVKRREAGNLKATEMLVTAKKVSRLLMHFPFVRGVAISGSLSKNY